MFKKSSLQRKVATIVACLAISGFIFSSCEVIEQLGGEKKITAFGFSSPAAVGVINESAKTIAVDVPTGTNVTALAPVIAVSEGATVSPGSGVPNNFTNPATYTVTAADGSTAAYVVTVTVGTSSGGTDPGGEQPSGTPQELKGYIGESRTLPDLGFAIDYIVPNWVEFNNNAVITVDPGVCIAFQTTDGTITVSGGATIKMLGTAAKPIQLRGAGATSGTEKGSWGYLNITTNSDNILQYVEFINGGKSTSDGVVRLSNSGQLSMSNCKINGSLGLGLSTSSGVLKKFENNVIENCNKEPVHLGHISQAAAFDESSTLANNADKFISISYGYLNGENMTIKPANVPYHLQGWIEVQKILTVNPGAKFLMDTDASITVSNIGCLKMLGTAERPISILGYVNSTEKGSWKYIDVNTNNENQFQYVEMVNGGDNASYGVVRIGSSGKASFDHVTINGSKGHGISTSSGATITAFTNNRIQNCNHSPVWLGHVSQTAVFDMTSNLAGNGDEDYVGISYGYLNEANITTNATTVPYYISSWIEVQKNWTINNATFYMHTDASVTSSNLGRIIAANCKFTRLPDMGYYWKYIEINGDNGGSFTGCTFEYGAKDTDRGMVELYKGVSVFTNCTFQHTQQFGVRFTGNNASASGSSGNTFTDCTKGAIRLYSGQTANNF